MLFFTKLDKFINILVGLIFFIILAIIYSWPLFQFYIRFAKIVNNPAAGLPYILFILFPLIALGLFFLFLLILFILVKIFYNFSILKLHINDQINSLILYIKNIFLLPNMNWKLKIVIWVQYLIIIIAIVAIMLSFK